MTIGTVGERTASNVSERDLAAAKKINEFRSGQLARIQTRAEKWISGLAALVGVVTTAVVIKGPETFTKLGNYSFGEGDRYLPAAVPVIGLMILGAILIGWGIWLANRAAYGDPISESELDDLIGESNGPRNYSLSGAATRWDTAVNSAYDSAKTSLKTASIVTVLGTTALLTALLVAWTGPAKESAKDTWCMQVNGSLVEFEGTSPPVVEGEITQVPCA